MSFTKFQTKYRSHLLLNFNIRIVLYLSWNIWISSVRRFDRYKRDRKKEGRLCRGQRGGVWGVQEGSRFDPLVIYTLFTIVSLVLLLKLEGNWWKSRRKMKKVTPRDLTPQSKNPANTMGTTPLENQIQTLGFMV